MFKIDSIYNLNCSLKEKILTNYTKNKKQSKNIKNFSKYEDPVNIIETYVHLKNWIFGFSDIYRNFLITILSPFAILILIDLLKKNFFIEAKFFVAAFFSDLDATYKVLFESMKSSFDNTDIQNKENFIIKNKIFYIEFPTHVFTNMISFFEQNFYLHFLKYINRYFKIKFLSNRNPIIKKREINLKNNHLKYNIAKFNKQYKFKNRNENLSNKRFEISNYNFPENLKFYKTLKIVCRNFDIINSVSISSDENTIVSGLDNSGIKVFDFINESSKNLSYNLIGHSASVSCVKISNCNNFVVSSSVNGELSLWSLEYKKKLINYENFNKPIWDISFSSKDNYFSTACGDSSSSLWITDRLFPVRFFIGHKSDINVTRWHPSNSIMATGSDDCTVRLWDIKTARSVSSYKKFDNNIYNIEFSPDGFEISISGLANYIDIWDIRTGKILKRIKDKNSDKLVKNLIYSPDGHFLVHNVKSKTLNFVARKNSKYKGESGTNYYPLYISFQKIYQIKFNSKEKITIVGI
nr:TATA box-binding protein-associated factor chain TAFII 90 [Cryptomonas curvata]